MNYHPLTRAHKTSTLTIFLFLYVSYNIILFLSPAFICLGCRLPGNAVCAQGLLLQHLQTIYLGLLMLPAEERGLGKAKGIVPKIRANLLWQS